MRFKTLWLAALVALASATAVHAQDTTPNNLSTEQQKLYKLPDGTWVEKVIVVDPSNNDSQGAAGTGYTPPSGGSGLLGYLSGIYHAITGTLTVQGASGGQPLPIAGTTANTVLSATNPMPAALYNASGTAVISNNTNTDALSVSGSNTALTTNSWGRLFNATNGSRMYEIGAATNAATGVTAVAIAGASWTNVTTATTTTVKSGGGLWQTLLVNSPAATTITCYNNTAASGSKIGTWTTVASTQPYAIPINLYFSTGLTCVTANAIDLTFVYR